MKEAFECLESAARCARLAIRVEDPRGCRQLEQAADQWRKLARDCERHRQQTASLRLEAKKE